MSRWERFGFSMEIDGAAVRDWYARAGEWDCGCGHCRNFLKEDKLYYQVNYRLPGKKLAGPERDSVNQGWGGVWCGDDPYPYGAPGFPKPHFDVSFFVWLPWVLDEPPEGE